MKHKRPTCSLTSSLGKIIKALGIGLLLLTPEAAAAKATLKDGKTTFDIDIQPHVHTFTQTAPGSSVKITMIDSDYNIHNQFGYFQGSSKPVKPLPAPEAAAPVVARNP